MVGIDGIKAEVVRSVNLFLSHQTFRDSMGGSARRGVLFEGPPGTGKTFVAKAMAKEAQVPFLFVSASAFQSMYFGQTNRKIRSFFKRLRKYARTEGGAIGFIEEIDAIGGARRGQGNGSSEGITGVVNELLVQLQSFETPSRGQRMRNAWVDIDQSVPARRRATAQVRRGAGERLDHRGDQPQGRPRPRAPPPGKVRPFDLLRASGPRRPGRHHRLLPGQEGARRRVGRTRRRSTGWPV